VWIEAGASESGTAEPAQFTAIIDGQPARVLSVRGPGDDLMVMLVLDFTGDLGLVETAKQAAADAVQSLPRKSTVALLRAQDGMQVVLDPTADHKAVARAIHDLPVTGHAGLFDTIEAACRIADRVLSKTPVRVAVVYLTDSSIYNYREDYTNPVINSSDSHDLSRRFPEGLVKQKTSSVDARIAALQAPLFIVHLAYRTDRLEQIYQAGQLQLAATAGGTATFCRSRAEIPRVIADTIANVAAHYRVDVELPGGHQRNIQVQIESHDLPLAYRSRFTFD
jgi:hypothetical protein